MANDQLQLRQFRLPNVVLTGTKIDGGSYASVEEVTVCGAICAAKKIHDILQDRSEIPENILRKGKAKFAEECQLLSTLRHPNIVQFIGVLSLPGSGLPGLVMERLQDNLHDFLEPADPPSDWQQPFFPLSLKCSILNDVACGLAYLHAQTPPVIHRDLTARNVLLSKGMVAKIADLGVARIMPGVNIAYMTTAPGSAVYMPPEACECENEEAKAKYGMGIDIFSFGVVAIFTLCEKFPQKVSAPTYYDGNGYKARSELECRKNYMEIIYDQLRKEHPLLKMIEGCLDFHGKRLSIHKVQCLLAKARAEVGDEKKPELVWTQEVQQELRRKEALLAKVRKSLRQKEDELKRKEDTLSRAEEKPELVRTQEFQQELRRKEALLAKARESLRQKEDELKRKEDTLSRAEETIITLKKKVNHRALSIVILALTLFLGILYVYLSGVGCTEKVCDAELHCINTIMQPPQGAKGTIEVAKFESIQGELKQCKKDLKVLQEIYEQERAEFEERKQAAANKLCKEDLEECNRQQEIYKQERAESKERKQAAANKAEKLCKKDLEQCKRQQEIYEQERAESKRKQAAANEAEKLCKRDLEQCKRQQEIYKQIRADFEKMKQAAKQKAKISPGVIRGFFWSVILLCRGCVGRSQWVLMITLLAIVDMCMLHYYL